MSDVVIGAVVAEDFVLSIVLLYALRANEGADSPGVDAGSH